MKKMKFRDGRDIIKSIINDKYVFISERVNFKILIDKHARRVHVRVSTCT